MIESVRLLTKTGIKPYFFAFLPASTESFGNIQGVWGITFKMVQAEAIDNASVINGKREEASYVGLFRVFSAFTYFFQSLIFFIVWTLTKYEPIKRADQTELARLGLKLLISIIPATLAVIAILVFVVMYTISKEDAVQNKKNLAKLGL